MFRRFALCLTLFGLSACVPSDLPPQNQRFTRGALASAPKIEPIARYVLPERQSAGRLEEVTLDRDSDIARAEGLADIATDLLAQKPEGAPANTLPARAEDLRNTAATVITDTTPRADELTERAKDLRNIAAEARARQIPAASAPSAKPGEDSPSIPAEAEDTDLLKRLRDFQGDVDQLRQRERQDGQ